MAPPTYAHEDMTEFRRVGTFLFKVKDDAVADAFQGTPIMEFSSE